VKQQQRGRIGVAGPPIKYVEYVNTDLAVLDRRHGWFLAVRRPQACPLASASSD